MCFNLKFCLAIKHHPLNIPYFFRFFKILKYNFHKVFTEYWFPYDILPKYNLKCSASDSNEFAKAQAKQ